MGIDYSGFKFAKEPSKKKKKNDITPNTRKKIKEMYNGRCALCGRLGNHIHHIRYRQEAPEMVDDVDNLILLCIGCHEEVHKNKHEWQPKLLKMKGVE